MKVKLKKTKTIHILKKKKFQTPGFKWRKSNSRTIAEGYQSKSNQSNSSSFSSCF